jgi:hypothetical protein
VQDLTDSHSRFVIRDAGAPRTNVSRLRVFIDGQYAGGLDVRRQTARPWLVTPGAHTISLSCVFGRSETVGVKLLPGQTAVLECGFGQLKMLDAYWWIAAWLAMTPLCMAELWLTGFAAGGLGLAGLGFVLWPQWTTPGAYLWLRPHTEVPSPRHALTDFTLRPRVTVRRSMFLVAVIAGLLAGAIEERRMQSRAENDELRRERYRAFAEMHAEQERYARASEAGYARMEAADLKQIENLPASFSADPGRESLKRQLEGAKQTLDMDRGMRTFFAKSAASEALLKEKYLRAAARPWETVEEDR